MRSQAQLSLDCGSDLGLSFAHAHRCSCVSVWMQPKLQIRIHNRLTYQNVLSTSHYRYEYNLARKLWGISFREVLILKITKDMTLQDFRTAISVSRF